MSQYRDGNRYVVKTTEDFQGETFIIKGTSVESYADARKAWRQNKDRRILLMTGQVKRKAGKIKLKKALPEWYDLYCSMKVTNGRPRSLLTIATDKSTMQQLIKDLGELYVCDIDSDTLQYYFNKLARSGASATTIRKRWILLNMFFKKRNPLDHPLLGCEKPGSMKHPENKKSCSDSELEAFMKAIEPKYAIISVILWQFLRVGEAIELRVKDVDLDKNVIRIRRQYDEKNHIVTPPKDNSSRDVPISEKCRKILLEAIKDKDPEDLVFRNRYKGQDHHYLRSCLLDATKRACLKAGIKILTVHDLRHEGISYLVRHGVKPLSIKKWAGHSKLTITLDIYFRDTEQDSPEDLEIMEGKKNVQDNV